MIKGERNSALSVSRPAKLYRVMASPAGTAISVASVADANASHRLFQNDCTRSECANTALNQRSDRWVLGRVSVFSGVKATRQTITSGASMNTMTRALNTSARGLFLNMRAQPIAFL